MKPCPCGSQQAYVECCQPLHLFQRHAATPKALMASRYCAFACGQAHYLFETHHPDFRHDLSEAELAEACAQSQWLGLQIDADEMNEHEGYVTFKAWYREGNSIAALHERSRFIRQQQRWYYCDGKLFKSPKAPSRNDLCICGSTQKFKRCCG